MHIINSFKNLRDARIDLDRPFTVMIGRNGSGKSNVVEAIELLGRIASGTPLHEVGDAGRAGFAVRGGLRSCVNPDSKELNLGVRLASDEYYVTLRSNGQPYIAREYALIGDRGIFVAQATDSQSLLSVQFDNFDRGPMKPTTQRPGDRSVLSQYEVLPITKQNDPRRQCLEGVERLRSYLKASFVFDPQPRSMRSYERQGDDVLAADGHNVSAVLYSLHRSEDSASAAALSRILAALQQLPEEPFDGIEFVTTKLDDVIFALKSTTPGELVDARVISDGTLRCLAILVALETVQRGSRVIVEEFDNGLHPSRVGVLTAAIQECATRRTLNVLVTTQNPATLDSLTREQLDAVVVCHWQPARRSSTLTPLRDVPGADFLLERGQLGDLVTRRVLEEHLMPGFEERRLADARKWLESLP